jgi:hypothetical protein
LIKAKLVAVESKRISIKEEFLAYTMMPDGRTVSEWLQPCNLPNLPGFYESDS